MIFNGSELKYFKNKQDKDNLCLNTVELEKMIDVKKVHNVSLEKEGGREGGREGCDGEGGGKKFKERGREGKRIMLDERKGHKKGGRDRKGC
jgi:hypothetical protein